MAGGRCAQGVAGMGLAGAMFARRSESCPSRRQPRPTSPSPTAASPTRSSGSLQGMDRLATGRPGAQRGSIPPLRRAEVAKFRHSVSTAIARPFCPYCQKRGCRFSPDTRAGIAPRDSAIPPARVPGLNDRIDAILRKNRYSLGNSPSATWRSFLGWSKRTRPADLGDQARLDQPAKRARECLAGEIQVAGHVTLQARQLDRAVGRSAFDSASSKQEPGQPSGRVAERDVFHQRDQPPHPKRHAGHHAPAQFVIFVQRAAETFQRQQHAGGFFHGFGRGGQREIRRWRPLRRNCRRDRRCARRARVRRGPTGTPAPAPAPPRKRPDTARFSRKITCPLRKFAQPGDGGQPAETGRLDRRE